MEAVFIYIAKSASLMLLFYCVYFFLLRKETFFNSNRWFLLAGLLVAAILPLLSFTKVIWIDAVPHLTTNIQPAFIPVTEKESLQFNWTYLLIGAYSVGFLVFIIKFAIDFYSLNSVIRGKKVKQQADFKFIDVKENIAPFSYFEYIVYNSSLYTATELENIIEHEKVHSDQNHTLDVLISRIFSIIFWFNPIVWFYKKAITQNLEFIADSEAAKKISDKKAYQYTLLKITTHENCVAITNHFYQSLIKKRIVMLNKNQSKKRNSWKYYVVIPALAAFILLFQIEVIAKEKPQIIKMENESNIKSIDVYKIRKNTTDAELDEIKNNLQKDHNVKFEVSEIKRNDSNQLTSIIVDVKKGKQRAKSMQNSDNAINEFGVLVITYNNGDKKIGIQTVNDSHSKKSKNAVSKSISTANADTEDDSKKSSNYQIIVTQNKNSNTDTNVNINSSTSTKTNSNTNTNSSTFVTTNVNDDVTTITTSSDAKPRIVVSNKSNTDLNGNTLIIVDGKVMPEDFDLEDLKPNQIKTMSVYNGIKATAKYGEKGKDGVIEIETHK